MPHSSHRGERKGQLFFLSQAQPSLSPYPIPYHHKWERKRSRTWGLAVGEGNTAHKAGPKLVRIKDHDGSIIWTQAPVRATLRANPRDKGQNSELQARLRGERPFPEAKGSPSEGEERPHYGR